MDEFHWILHDRLIKIKLTIVLSVINNSRTEFISFLWNNTTNVFLNSATSSFIQRPIKKLTISAIILSTKNDSFPPKTLQNKEKNLIQLSSKFNYMEIFSLILTTNFADWLTQE